MANLHFQLSWYNQISLLPPPTQHHSFFRNFHPLFLSWYCQANLWVTTPKFRYSSFHLICLCFLCWPRSSDETSTNADPTNLSLFLGFLTSTCLMFLSHNWITKHSSLICQVREGDVGSATSLECFSSQTCLPSPESCRDDTLEHMGALQKNSEFRSKLKYIF